MQEPQTRSLISNLEQLADLADYSLMDQLNCDPDATTSGEDYHPRQVFSGHYVPVKPTPIAHPHYVAHSKHFFEELGFDEQLAKDDGFIRLFSGDMSRLPASLKKTGWATGYALSIYGTEYIQQCPFYTGNGYGDGRALSVLEAVINDKRWEFQLKGGGRTPYCRGADGRAVLRSSVREFLAQEHMHALGVPTSRSLCLFVSESETVQRPWYSEGASDPDPDILVSNPVAITTRVAPSFLRVGQLELFGRRARSQSHPEALNELELIVRHLIEREYKADINSDLAFTEQILALAMAFSERLSSLVSHWLRVGYCQGNFNSDNCAAGGFTLDYGPFGFCERFDPFFQPWTGGGRHFSFLNQSAAAAANFGMFCSALAPLLESTELEALNKIRDDFPKMMQEKMERMWAAKLGLDQYNGEILSQLLKLMVKTSVDYTIFFRELAAIPEDFTPLKASFYKQADADLEEQWHAWFASWKKLTANTDSARELMLSTNPKYTWREWLVVPAYETARTGNYHLIAELQYVYSKPYADQTAEVEEKYYRLMPQAYFNAGGVSHYSCSS